MVLPILLTNESVENKKDLRFTRRSFIMAESEGVQRPCVLWLCAAVDVADPGVACATQASGTTIHIRPIAELYFGTRLRLAKAA